MPTKTAVISDRCIKPYCSGSINASSIYLLFVVGYLLFVNNQLSCCFFREEHNLTTISALQIIRTQYLLAGTTGNDFSIQQNQVVKISNCLSQIMVDNH